MRRRASWTLVLIVAAALVARLAVVVATPDYQPLFDARDYDRHARSIAAGDGYPRSNVAESPSAFRPPLYPLALAGVRILGGGLTAERLLGVLLGVLTVLLIYEIARRLWGTTPAAMAGGIAAIFPPLVVLSVSLLSELLFLPLVLAALLAVLQYREDRRLRWAAAAGAATGLAVLTRTNGLVLVAALAPALWLGRPRLSRAALAAPALAIVVMCVMLVPWTVRNAFAFDRFVGLTTQGGLALASTYSAGARAIAPQPGAPEPAFRLPEFRPIFARPGLDEAERLGRLNDAATRYMREHPGYVLETMAWNVLRVFGVIRPPVGFKLSFQAEDVQALGAERLASPIVPASLFVLLPLALLGVVSQIRGGGPRRAPAVVWAVPILLLLPALAVYGLARYRAPVDPFLVLLAAVGLAALCERLRAGRGGGSRAAMPP